MAKAPNTVIVYMAHNSQAGIGQYNPDFFLGGNGQIIFGSGPQQYSLQGESATIGAVRQLFGDDHIAPWLPASTPVTLYQYAGSGLVAVSCNVATIQQLALPVAW